MGNAFLQEMKAYDKEQKKNPSHEKNQSHFENFSRMYLFNIL